MKCLLTKAVLPALISIVVAFTWFGNVGHGQEPLRVSPETLALNQEPMHPLERLNLERNLRWMLERSRGIERNQEAQVAVFVDAGVWHPGARSIVDCLEKEGIPVRTIDGTTINEQGLAGVKTLFLAGGWAPLQMQAAGEDGLESIRKFVEEGGRCIGICAGAYLLSDIVKYDGQAYDYPLGLFPGIAEGPVEGLSHYPVPGATRINSTDAGKTWQLDSIQDSMVYYSGGAFFHPKTNTQVLATYPNGTASIVRHSVKKGEVLLLGIHLERPCPSDGDESAPPPVFASKLFKRFCEPSSSSN